MSEAANPAGGVFRLKAVSLLTWKWEGFVSTGGTLQDFIAAAKAYGDVEKIEASPSTAGRAYVELGKPWMIWVEDLADVPALAHEALHVASGVLEARGLRHVPESEEAYTYTMEHIMREALDGKGWQQP